MNDKGSFLLTAGIFSKSPMPGVTALAMVNGAWRASRAGWPSISPAASVSTRSARRSLQETAQSMGLPGGLPASENAKAYVALVEGSETGQVVFNG